MGSKFRIKSLMINVASDEPREPHTACGGVASCRRQHTPTHCKWKVTCDPGPADTMCGEGRATCGVIPPTHERSTCSGDKAGKAEALSEMDLLQKELRRAMSLER